MCLMREGEPAANFVLSLAVSDSVIIMFSLLTIGFKHRYTVTSTPTEEANENKAANQFNGVGNHVPPKSPGTSRLRLLSRKF